MQGIDTPTPTQQLTFEVKDEGANIKQTKTCLDKMADKLHILLFQKACEVILSFKKLPTTWTLTQIFFQL